MPISKRVQKLFFGRKPKSAANLGRKKRRQYEMLADEMKSKKSKNSRLNQQSRLVRKELLEEIKTKRSAEQGGLFPKYRSQNIRIDAGNTAV